VSSQPHQAGSAGRRARRWLRVAFAGAVVAALAACGSSAGDDSGDSGDGGGGSDGAYPRTVATLYGDVTIPTAPTRVVALSFASADELLSLGVTPITVAADPKTLDDMTPWVADEIRATADASLTTASYELNVEAIAAAKPDLIVAQTWQIKDKAAFDQLNAVAPTVAPDSDALNVDWDVRLRTTADAVDKADEAQKLIADIQAEFAAVGDAVPDISSKTYQWVRVDPDGFGFGNGAVFGLFGLKPGTLQDNTQNSAPLSLEQTSKLDADLLAVWARSADLRTSIDDSKLFQQLPAVRSGAVYYADMAFANALNSPGPLALRWLKDQLTPTIEKLAG